MNMPAYLSSRSPRLRAEADGRQDGERSEEDQNGELRDHERRLLLRRGERLEGWHLEEELDDQHKDVEVKRNRGGNHVDPPPGAGEVERVAQFHSSARS